MQSILAWMEASTWDSTAGTRAGVGLFVEMQRKLCHIKSQTCGIGRGIFDYLQTYQLKFSSRECSC